MFSNARPMSLRPEPRPTSQAINAKPESKSELSNMHLHKLASNIRSATNAGLASQNRQARPTSSARPASQMGDASLFKFAPQLLHTRHGFSNVRPMSLMLKPKTASSVRLESWNDDPNLFRAF